MRPLELTLLLLLLAWGGVAIASLKKARPAWQRVFLFLLSAALAAHLIWEGWRLQMAPAYLAILLVLLSGLNIADLATRVFLISSVGLAAVFSLAVAYAIPVFTLPAP